jgi:hypothetical protein
MTVDDSCQNPKGANKMHLLWQLRELRPGKRRLQGLRLGTNLLISGNSGRGPKRTEKYLMVMYFGSRTGHV